MWLIETESAGAETPCSTGRRGRKPDRPFHRVHGCTRAAYAASSKEKPRFFIAARAVVAGSPIARFIIDCATAEPEESSSR